MGVGALDLHPAEWLEVVKGIGLGGAVILILTLSMGMAIATRGPEILNSFNRILDTVLKHRREKLRIEDKIKKQKANLTVALEARKLKNSTSGGGSKS